MGRSKQRARDTAPAWVPPLVVSVVGKMRGFSPEIVDRLLTFPRMETVWHTLRQIEVKALPEDLPDNLRVRNRIEPSLLTRDASLNDEAAAAFFACVVIETRLKNKLARKDISAFATRLADAAETARMVRLNPFLHPVDTDVDALAKTEAILAQLAAEVRRTSPKGHPLILERRTENDTERAIVRSIATTTKDIFGQRLYGTVAAAVSVALNLTSDITPEDVRDWCEGLLSTPAK
jgi:hypothetical protein